MPGTVRAAAEQAENFLNGTRLTAGMVSAFIENVFVHSPKAAKADSFTKRRAVRIRSH